MRFSILRRGDIKMNHQSSSSPADLPIQSKFRSPPKNKNVPLDPLTKRPPSNCHHQSKVLVNPLKNLQLFHHKIVPKNFVHLIKDKNKIRNVEWEVNNKNSENYILKGRRFVLYLYQKKEIIIIEWFMKHKQLKKERNN